jgi:predicted O-linked N-acetylglucosamine transferase (SPINDLY family)
LKSKAFIEAEACERVRQRFTDSGIDGTRIECMPWKMSDLEHQRAYHTIDIALDCFPYNGTTTTCEALWMGVPVVALGGQGAHCGRVGASLLTAAGCPEWIARNEDDYVRMAAALAADLEQLAAIRAALRPRLAKSSLCDGAAMARALEEAFATMCGRK